MVDFGKSKTLGIFVPPELRGRFGVPAWLDNDYYFLLPFQFDQIAVNDTYLGETGYTVGFAKMAYNGPRRVQRGYEFQTPEGRASIYYLLSEIAKLPGGNPYTPVMIKDFVRPETADWELALTGNGVPYTVRTGALLDLKVSGFVGTTAAKTYASKGFSFRFVEDVARPC